MKKEKEINTEVALQHAKLAVRNEIEARLQAARRLYEITARERAGGNAEYAADGAIEACGQLLAIIARQQREIERLERESAPLVKPRGTNGVQMENGYWV